MFFSKIKVWNTDGNIPSTCDNLSEIKFRNDGEKTTQTMRQRPSCPAREAALPSPKGRVCVCVCGGRKVYVCVGGGGRHADTRVLFLSKTF